MDEIEILYKAFANRTVNGNITIEQEQKDVAEKKLLDTMTKEQKELLSDLLFYCDGAWIQECAYAYRKGFQAGMRLLSDALRNG